MLLLTLTVAAILASSPVIQCQATLTTGSPYEYNLRPQQQPQYRPSLRNLFFTGLFLRPFPVESEIQTFQMAPVEEIANNDLPEEEPATEPTPIAPAEAPPAPPASVFSRFASLQNRLSLDKAILPEMPLVRQVSSDRVVKKIIFTAPKLSETIPDLNMSD